MAGDSGSGGSKEGSGDKTEGSAPAPSAMRRNDVSMTDMSDVDTGDNLYHVRKSRLIRLINWWQVRTIRLYITV